MPSSKTKVDSDFIKLGSEVYLRKPSVASDDGESPKYASDNTPVSA